MVALFPGSFDPPTKAHIWLINRALEIFGELAVVVANNPDKSSFLSYEEKVEIITESVSSKRLRVLCLRNRFIAILAGELGAKFLVRGVRNQADFDYESTMSQFNSEIFASRFQGELVTIFFASPANLSKISSSAIRSVMHFEGGLEIISEYLTDSAIEIIRKRINV